MRDWIYLGVEQSATLRVTASLAVSVLVTAGGDHWCLAPVGFRGQPGVTAEKVQLRSGVVRGQSGGNSGRHWASPGSQHHTVGQNVRNK